MNATKNETIDYHGEWQCQFMDLDAHVKDCSNQDPAICIVCQFSGKFFTGESIRDYYSTGHLLCLIMWILTVLIGTSGVFANILNISVFRARKLYRPFDYLLTLLACADISVCVAAILSMSAHVARYQGWVSNSEFAVYWFYVGNVCLLLTRTISVFITILITIERFLVIAFPLRSKLWFTSGKTTLLALAAVLAAIIVNCSRAFSSYVERNSYNDIESLKDFEYLLRFSKLYCTYCINLWGTRSIFDFWAPPPILLLFNGISFILVRRIPATRRAMNVVQQKEIRALKMFMPVAAVVLITNTASIIHFYPIIYEKILYRELVSAFGLSVAINSAVNFHIYYYQRPAFQKETKDVLNKWLAWICVLV